MNTVSKAEPFHFCSANSDILAVAHSGTIFSERTSVLTRVGVPKSISTHAGKVESEAAQREDSLGLPSLISLTGHAG